MSHGNRKLSSLAFLHTPPSASASPSPSPVLVPSAITESYHTFILYSGRRWLGLDLTRARQACLTSLGQVQDKLRWLSSNTQLYMRYKNRQVGRRTRAVPSAPAVVDVAAGSSVTHYQSLSHSPISLAVTTLADVRQGVGEGTYATGQESPGDKGGLQVNGPLSRLQ